MDDRMSVAPAPQISVPPVPAMSVAPEPQSDSEPAVTLDAATQQCRADLFSHYAEPVCEGPVAGPTAAPAPAPRLGLDAYDVVPDDFIGPLAPNQIHQAQANDLRAYNFDQFNVVPDDFIGPLSNTQMHQADYAALQGGWLNIAQGRGMELSGAQADQDTFRRMMRDGMTDSPEFRRMLTSIGNDSDPAHLLHAGLGRSQPGVIGDSFADNSVDLDDIEAFPAAAPAAHPDQFTRNELMIHFLTERQSALGSADPTNFSAAHQAGIDAQSRYRDERGQSHVVSQTGAANPDGTITANIAMANGSSEQWGIDGNQRITSVRPPTRPAPPAPAPAPAPTP